MVVGLVLAGSVLPAAAPARANLPGLAGGCTLFPADNVWHADVSRLPVHPRSADWIASMGGADRRLHPDFGPNDGGGQPYGIPYSVVPGSAQKVAVSFDYADESDPGPYPFGPSTPIEDGSDAHALVVDKDACRLYELYAAAWNGGHPTAGSGAIWDLHSDGLRPRGWTSADAAGLPILPGLLRRDEVLAGDVDHAIRLTAARTDRSFLWPARHQAGSAADPTLPPMGAWFRLKASFDLSHFRADSQVVLRAMQRHGLIVADNGSNWYFTGTSEPGWDNALLDELKTVPAGAFEAVDASSLMADPNSGRVAGAAAPTPPPPTTTTTARPTPTTARPTTTTARPTTTTTRPEATSSTDPGTTATTAGPTTTTTAAGLAAAPPDGGRSRGEESSPAAPGGSHRWVLLPATVAASALALAAWRRRRRRPGRDVR